MSIELSGCSYQVGDALLLHGIDLELRAAEVVAAVGPNGAGKSTLLRMLSGELLPSTGTARFDGRPLANWPLRELAMRLGVLPQHSTLAFPFRVEEVVALGRIPHASGRDRDRAIVHEILARLDLTAIADRDYTTLSGGEQQRTQIGRVLAQVWEGGADRVLLLDEPSAFLDLAHRHAILELVRECARGGMAVLLVLHDINLAARYADRILLLDHGRLEASGAPFEVLTPENVARVFRVAASIVAHPQLDRPLIVTG